MKITYKIHVAVMHKIPFIIARLKKVGFKDNDIEVISEGFTKNKLIITITDKEDQTPDNIFLLGTLVGQLESI